MRLGWTRLHGASRYSNSRQARSALHVDKAVGNTSHQRMTDMMNVARHMVIEISFQAGCFGRRRMGDIRAGLGLVGSVSS